MTSSKQSYVHRTDRDRRRKRTRQMLLAGGLLVTGSMALRNPQPTVATAATAKPLAALVAGRHSMGLRAPSPEHGFAIAPLRTVAGAPRGLAATAESLGTMQRLRRWHRVYRFAGHYGVAPDLAAAIHDVALAEGIEPDLAFRLVRAESEFKETAKSPVGAVGLTQVMPSTARYYVPGVSRRHLYDRHLNLHVGFRYLRGLIRQYGDLRIALLAYNRGPGPVEAALKRGDDPANGYEDAVAKGYTGRGVVER